MSFNPLAIIINQNKLTRPNYVDWKRNLDIVLTTEEYKYILTEEYPDLPTANALSLERERYETWVKADKMTRWYILALISSIFTTSAKRLFEYYEYDLMSQRDV